jgi:hypothetical protein
MHLRHHRITDVSCCFADLQSHIAALSHPDRLTG